MSKILTLFGIKWYFILLPISSNYSSSDIDLWLGIADIPSNIAEVAVYYRISFPIAAG